MTESGAVARLPPRAMIPRRFRSASLRHPLMWGALTLLATACSSSPLLPEPEERIIIDLGADVNDWPRDDWQRHSARIDDARLHLTVTYGGGCRAHHFWLVAVGDWHVLPSSGPTPRLTIPVLVAHDAHGDPCEALVTRDLTFDLEPLRTAYREDFDTFGPATILLQIPMGQGSPDSVAVPLDVPVVYPPD